MKEILTNWLGFSTEEQSEKGEPGLENKHESVWARYTPVDIIGMGMMFIFLSIIIIINGISDLLEKKRG